MLERHFRGLEQFAKFLERQAVESVAATEAAAVAVTDVLYENAHKTFGDVSKLESLAPATQEERARLGYSENEPLLRDGSLLRDNVEKEHGPVTGGIGSAEMVQLYHELGYVNARTGTSVPPRPVFKIALDESEPVVLELQQEIAAVTFGLGVVRRLRE